MHLLSSVSYLLSSVSLPYPIASRPTGTWATGLSLGSTMDSLHELSIPRVAFVVTSGLSRVTSMMQCLAPSRPV